MYLHFFFEESPFSACKTDADQSTIYQRPSNKRIVTEPDDSCVETTRTTTFMILSGGKGNSYNLALSSPPPLESTLDPSSSNSIFFPLIKASCKAQPILTAFTAPWSFIGGGVSSRQQAVNSLASVMKASLNRP